MRLALTIALLSLLALALSGCDLVDVGSARIDGQIAWQEGGPLPPGSTVTVRIVDATLADATETLAVTTFEAEGSPPLDFWVEYDASAIDERMQYSATVRIEDANGELLYITQTTQIVIDDGEPVEPISILVEPV